MQKKLFRVTAVLILIFMLFYGCGGGSSDSGGSSSSIGSSRGNFAALEREVMTKVAMEYPDLEFVRVTNINQVGGVSATGEVTLIVYVELTDVLGQRIEMPIDMQVPESWLE